MEHNESSCTDRRTFLQAGALVAGRLQRFLDLAEKEGLSLNAWLVRAVAAALEPEDSRRTSARGRQSYTGWVR